MSNNVRFHVNVITIAFRVAKLHQSARLVHFLTAEEVAAALLTERRLQTKKEI
jgi:hypothetical protein